jgi:broad specificity phosphatase PhoE
MPRLLLALVLLSLSSLGWAGICDDPAGTTVYLVRHAEKLEGPDPALTEAGQLRAIALRDRLAGIPLDAIYVTQWQRTRLTAEPVARARNLPVHIRSTESRSALEHAQEVVDDLIENHCGQTVLVVGHSNTVPHIIGGLTGQVMEDMDERDYDRFFQVWFGLGRSAELVQSRFGAVNRAEAP